MPYRIETRVSPEWAEEEEWVLLAFRPRKKGRFETESQADAVVAKMKGCQPHAIFRVVWTEK